MPIFTDGCLPTGLLLKIILIETAWKEIFDGRLTPRPYGVETARICGRATVEGGRHA